MMVRRLLFLLCVMSLAMAASATRIQIGEPLCKEGDKVVTDLINGFSVSPVNGGGTFTFCNETGEDWTTVLLGIRTTLTQDQIDCTTTAFEFCDKSTQENAPGVVFAYFSGVSNGQGEDGVENEDGPRRKSDDPPLFPGVPNGHEFTVSFDCIIGNSTCTGPPDWPDGTKAYGSANLPDTPGDFPVPPVPEPASLVLVASGVAAEVLRRKRSA